MQQMRNTSSQATSYNVLRSLLKITFYSSIFFAIIEFLFFDTHSRFGPLNFFSLSWSGIKHFYFWQPISYFFINSIPDGISFSWLMNLGLSLYFIWFLGTNLCDNFGEKNFLKFYLFTGIISGLLTIFLVPIFRTNLLLTGQASVILSSLTVWLMKNKNSQLYLFHLFPIKTQTLIFICLGTIFLFKLEYLTPLYFIYYLISILVGYFYALIVWSLHSPFKELHHFEKKIHHLSWRISSYRLKK